MAHIQTIHRIIENWKAGALEGVLEQLHEDVVYHYAVGQRPLEGREKVRWFLEKFGAGQTEIAWKITNHIEDADRLFLEGVDDYVDPDGVHICTPYAGVFEFKDGLVWRWRDYVDTGLIASAKRGEAPADWLRPLLDAPSSIPLDGSA